MIRILFVDDDPDILAILRVKLKSMQPGWQMFFAEGGREALVMLQRGSFDVIVSDLLMPDVDGITLLNAVMKRYPDTIRIVLSGTSDKELKLRSIHTSHQFVSKPFDITNLNSIVVRALNLRNLLSNKTLKNLTVRMTSLPSLPALYAELLREIQSPDSKLSRIGTIISSDIGMTAKILQLVNSAYFGMPRKVSTIQHAAQLLGLENLKSLVLGYEVFAQFPDISKSGLSLTKVMEHSARVGACARLIAKTENQDESVTNDAFVSGMLHDVGKLVLAANLPKQYSKILELAKYGSNSLWEIEQETFGISHAEVGGYLLGLWRLPNSIVETVAFHHRPSDCQLNMFGPLTAVHVANSLDHEARAAIRKSSVIKVETDYLETLGIAEKLAYWREVCSEATQEDQRAET